MAAIARTNDANATALALPESVPKLSPEFLPVIFADGASGLALL